MAITKLFSRISPIKRDFFILAIVKDNRKNMILKHHSTLDLGGTCRADTPLQDPILSFSHTFSLKSARVGGPHPSKGSTPPYGKSWVHH